MLKNKMEIPIEVKYKKKVEESGLPELKAFIAERKLPFGIVVTKDMLMLKNKILYIPCWLFLLVLSSS